MKMPNTETREALREARDDEASMDYASLHDLEQACAALSEPARDASPARPGHTGRIDPASFGIEHRSPNRLP